MATQKERLAIDLDDVLSLSAQGFVDFSNRRFETELAYEEYTENWTEWWGVTHEETNRRNQIIWEEGAALDFLPVPESQESIAHLAKSKDLFIVTSRPVIARAISETWLQRVYGDVFQEVIFAGFYDKGVDELAYQGTKAEILKRIGARYLVDDQPKHANPAAEQGIGALLFGDYSWNRHAPIHNTVVRTRHWRNTVEFFDAIAA